MKKGHKIALIIIGSVVIIGGALIIDYGVRSNADKNRDAKVNAKAKKTRFLLFYR